MAKLQPQDLTAKQSRTAGLSALWDLAGSRPTTMTKWEALADRLTQLRDSGAVTEDERAKTLLSIRKPEPPKPRPTPEEQAASKAARADAAQAAQAADKLIPYDNSTPEGKLRVARAWENI